MHLAAVSGWPLILRWPSLLSAMIISVLMATALAPTAMAQRGIFPRWRSDLRRNMHARDYLRPGRGAKPRRVVTGTVWHRPHGLRCCLYNLALVLDELGRYVEAEKSTGALCRFTRGSSGEIISKSLPSLRIWASYIGAKVGTRRPRNSTNVRLPSD